MLRNYNRDICLGYQQVIGAAGATALTVPPGSQFCIITPEAQAIRWRDDGTNPTAAIGYPLAVGNELVYTGNLATFRMIEQVAGTTVNICYYGAGL